MREHEVPTHVQAEDKVLLWLTFPQVVSLIAVAAVGYGIFNYAPGPTALRIGIAAAASVVGAAAAVGQIGGRRLPMVVGDLLKYWLGSRRFVGQVEELVRSAPVLAVESDPGLFERMQEKGRRRFRRLCRRRDRRDGGKRNRRSDAHEERKPKGSKPPTRDRGARGISLGRRRWVVATAMIILVATVIPQVAIAQGEGDEGNYGHSEVDLELPPPVLGRRVFIEGIAVSGNQAQLSVRAATDISLIVRAYGGEGGGDLRYTDQASLRQGETATFDVPLSTDNPSISLSWVDSLGQAGGFSLSEEQILHRLPSADGELCDVELTGLSLTRTGVSGSVSTICERQVMETMELRTVSGLDPVEVMTVREAEVTGITGRLHVRLGNDEVTVPLVADGTTSFNLALAPTEAVRDISLSADLRGTLRVPQPPLVEVSTVTERTVERSHVVSVLRPGVSRNIRETLIVECEDGTEERHRISVWLSVPARTIEITTRVPVTQKAYVTAKIVERDPAMSWRDETVHLNTTVWADAPYAALVLPEPEPAPETAEQVPASSGVVEDLFDRLGWDWPW